MIQFAIYEHASQVAQTTAAQALAATRVMDGTTASGQAEADSMLANLGQRRHRRSAGVGYPWRQPRPGDRDR